MSGSRRLRIQKLGRTKFILLYGVCGWGLLTGLLFGLAMEFTLGLPAFLLLHWLGVPAAALDPWSLVVFPMGLSIVGFAIGGFQWGSAMWEVVSSSPQSPSSTPCA